MFIKVYTHVVSCQNYVRKQIELHHVGGNGTRRLFDKITVKRGRQILNKTLVSLWAILSWTICFLLGIPLRSRP